jgi:hypothetical protein
VLSFYRRFAWPYSQKNSSIISDELKCQLRGTTNLQRTPHCSQKTSAGRIGWCLEEPTRSHSSNRRTANTSTQNTETALHVQCLKEVLSWQTSCVAADITGNDHALSVKVTLSQALYPFHNASLYTGYRQTQVLRTHLRRGSAPTPRSPHKIPETGPPEITLVPPPPQSQTKPLLRA